MASKMVMAIAAVLMLLIATVPANAASADPAVHITKMVIEPHGPDFNITVYYSSSFMTKIFSLLFGAKVIEPAIVDQLSGFADVKMTGIDPSGQVAKLSAKNQTWLANGWYVYNGNARFPVPLDHIEISGKSMDNPIIINNGSEIPTFFYRP